MELDNLERKLLYKQFIRREDQHFHETSDSEQRFYVAVKSGNIAFVDQLLKDHSLNKKENLGILSDSPLQNKKYHFVISAALVARHCIEGGMSREDAFLLSDLYIREVDALSSAVEIDMLLRKMFLTYTEKMRSISSKSPISKEVNLCISYIYEHLHERITTQTLAQYIGFDRSYLSRIFKAQIGECLNSYIIHKKLETARNMLLYSDYEISMISQIFAFSSQSYFTSVFKKYYGETPTYYRDQHYQKVYG